ncbi:MAG: site-specific DNA-methyltransferase, partial [bacterium]|nr:site-specific DNA-methyltransferase [bacterium]
EESLDDYFAKIMDVCRELRRVLREDGTFWLNMGDVYAGSGRGRDGDGTRNPDTAGLKQSVGFKPKDLIGLGWMLVLMLQADGWWLRSEIIWNKPACMPGSQKDRPTLAHEHLFLLTKSAKYYYNYEAILEPYAESPLKHYALMPAGWFASPESNRVIEHRPSSHKGSKFNKGKTAVHQQRSSDAPRKDNPKGRMKRTVWTIPTQPTKEAHFAAYPEKLIEPCILAGSRPGDIVLDPFHGSGTTGRVAERLGRHWIGIDLNAEYVELANKRTAQTGIILNEGSSKNV